MVFIRRSDVRYIPNFILYFLCTALVLHFLGVGKFALRQFTSSNEVAFFESTTPTAEEVIAESVELLNDFGRIRLSSEVLLRLLRESKSEDNEIHVLLQEWVELKADGVDDTLKRLELPPARANITLAIMVCGDRKDQALVMLKSAVMFSLDANLHVVVVSDLDTVISVGLDMSRMKIWLSEIGYYGFTYELQLEWYPGDDDGPDWKAMYKKCATQRLFFPSLLKHHDSLIFMDTDVLVLANLTEMWQKFQYELRDTKMLGTTPNSESPGYYNPGSPIPYYGKNGINAGVMLMNLTQLREFNFESRAKSIYTAYGNKIVLADQDIINAIFHTYPDKIVDIGCAHNFYWMHCDYPYYSCVSENRTSNICFCNQASEAGVRVLHGNSESFSSDHKEYPFVKETYVAFKEFNLFSDSYAGMFQSLREWFNQLNPSPCFPMTADVLYSSADKYLSNLGLK